MLARSVDLSLVRSSRNILLRRMSPADQAMLEPHFEEMPCDRGTAVIRRDQPLDALYFPDTALVSLEEQVGHEGNVEIAVVGREGLLGWPALLGCERAPHDAVVQMRPGTVLRIGVAPLQAACDRSPTLWLALLRFVHIVILQMARSIASHLQDSLDQRLARWLLMRHDRVGGDHLLVHHEEVADSLNVRRASVTDQLHVLEGDRLIRCNRGRILIRDRAGLESFAGDSYGITEAQYRTLIAPFGKSATPALVS